MNHSLYIRCLLLTVLMLVMSACGQKGPLVAPPDVPPAKQPATADMPVNDTLPDEADD